MLHFWVGVLGRVCLYKFTQSCNYKTCFAVNEKHCEICFRINIERFISGEMSDYRADGLWSCRTIELSDYRAVGLSSCRTIEPSDYRGVRL